ncbi:tyrosine-type recombinase/integrase [Microbacterium sp.]|uniref:tyrosine-type recombinase/integrase n=1 Tax=Microbacterium sp. TaxID=51671 RepID=UPI003F9E7A2C
MKRTSRGGYTTADEADEGLRDALARLKQRLAAATPKGLTLDSFAAEWLDGLDVAPSTEAGYRRQYRLYVSPQIGTVLIDSITTTRLRKLYRELRKSGGKDGAPLSANTVRKVHVLIGAILDSAMDDGLIASNPARRTKLAKPPTGRQVREGAPEMATWNAEQINAFMAWDRDTYRDEHFTFWLVLARTGMRRSEGLALRWSDVDMKRRRISVRRAADTINIGATKATKSGKARVIDVDDEIISALKAWKALRGSLSLDLARSDSTIFGNDEGGVINPNRATMRWSVRVAAARKTLGEDALPAIPLHGLRHSHATMLLQAGVHPRVVQERLGHADISITLGVYSHVTETMQRDAVDRLAQIFSGTA